MPILSKDDKVAIIACSNGQPLSNKLKIENLLDTLKTIGLM